MWNTIDKIPIVAIVILSKLPFANSIISCIIFLVWLKVQMEILQQHRLVLILLEVLPQ
jgi:hypothetical protein